ncbi:retrotransposon ORF1 [Tanacetum coccineum]
MSIKPKIPCNIGHVHVEKAYIDLNSPLNVMTRMLYNWIMRRKLDPREDPNRGVSNFTRRIRGMHVFVGNFTYVVDFMIVEDISSIIDPRLSQVVLGMPFVEISNMTHDLSPGVVKFTDEINEIAYKMPYKIEQYNSLSDLEKEHTKLVYLRNEEDKRRGVEYVMSKILGFYKECLELGHEYLTGVADEGEVTQGHDSTQTILKKFQTVAGDSVANLKRQHQDYSSDGVKDFQTASERSRLKETLEDSTGRRLIMEYLVNISKRRAFWSLNEDILKINDSDYQYAVSIKEDTAYLCLHSPKTTKETSSIRRIKDIVCEDSRRYQACNDINIELNKEFLVELRKNIYHGTYNEDVVDQFAKGDGKITTWEELIEKFFCRFYTESYDGEDEMLDKGDNWGIDPNVNTLFKNHKKLDGRTKKPDTATDSFFKSYDIRDIEENNGQGQLKCKDDNWNNK